MEVIRIAVLAALTSCVAVPVAAGECFPATEALTNMASNGYTITYGDQTGPYPLFIAEDGKGGWVVYAIDGFNLCPIIGGQGGVAVPRKPNT